MYFIIIQEESKTFLEKIEKYSYIDYIVGYMTWKGYK